MSCNSDFSQDFNSISTSGSLASDESWQDMQDELPEALRAEDSLEPFSSERIQDQAQENGLKDFDNSKLSLGEDNTLSYPAQRLEAGNKTARIGDHQRVHSFASFEDGNIVLVVGDNSFRLHEYKLEEFLVIKNMIKAEREAQVSEMNTAPLRVTIEEDISDVCNMLSVLYLPVYAAETQKFSVDVLKSTLRLATTFQHPTLRSFAIQRLENEEIPPIERIIMSRQSNVPSWMLPALDELCLREAPISYTEAVALGTKTFVEVAARREVYKSMAGHGLVTFKAALRSKAHNDPDLVEARSGWSRVVDSELVVGHNSALDHIITTAFSVVSSETQPDNGRE